MALRMMTGRRMMATSHGTVKWFDKTKGFGFLYNDESDEEVFVHQTNVSMDGYRYLVEGQKVTFDIKNDGGRVYAIDVVAESMAPEDEN